jgi:hypothetical protein
LLEEFNLRVFVPAASQDITAAQGVEEAETELPSLESLLGFDPTGPHSNSEDALNHNSLTASTLQVQGRAEVPGPTGVPILQEPSDREFDAQAPLVSGAGEARWPAAFALEDKPVLMSGNSSASKRSDHSTDKYPGCGADVRPSSKRQLKRLSARQQRAFCEAHKLKDKLKAAKIEWALRKYPRIGWRRLDARLQKFSPCPPRYFELSDPVVLPLGTKVGRYKEGKPQFRCMENATAGYYGPRGKEVM